MLRVQGQASTLPLCHLGPLGFPRDKSPCPYLSPGRFCCKASGHCFAQAEDNAVLSLDFILPLFSCLSHKRTPKSSPQHCPLKVFFLSPCPGLSNPIGMSTLLLSSQIPSWKAYPGKILGPAPAPQFPFLLQGLSRFCILQTYSAPRP